MRAVRLKQNSNAVGWKTTTVNEQKVKRSVVERKHESQSVNVRIVCGFSHFMQFVIGILRMS